MIVAVVSFSLGIAFAGYFGMKMCVGMGQMSILSEINAHSVSLDLLTNNKVEELKKTNCFVLKMSQQNHGQFSDNIWAIDNAFGSAEMTQALLTKVKAQANDAELCKNDS